MLLAVTKHKALGFPELLAKFVVLHSHNVNEHLSVLDTAKITKKLHFAKLFREKRTYSLFFPRILPELTPSGDKFILPFSADAHNTCNKHPCLERIRHTQDNAGP